MLGQFPEAINRAVIESMDVNEKMGMKALTSEHVAKGLASLVYRANGFKYAI